MAIAVAFLVAFHIARIARRKNRNPVGYVLTFVFAFIGLGVTGGIVSLVLSGFDPETGDDADFMLAFLPGVLIGYALAIGLGYVIIGAVPPLPKRYRDDEEYYDYDDLDAGGRPIRGPEDRDRSDDDVRSRRRPRDDDYDDYERPARPRDDY